MKNLEVDPEDTLRPEYKRSDFGDFIRGKYASTEVDFYQLTEALLACIGEDEGVTFRHHSIGNYLAQHKAGEWTYEIDNANQVTLRYWLAEFGSLEETISNPTSVTTPGDRSELQKAMQNGVIGLKARLEELNRP